MNTLTFVTQKKDEILDITQEIAQVLTSSKAQQGICTLFVLHTTCGITTADLDAGTDKDILSFLRAIQPRLSYRHPHNPKHAPDHILTSLIGSSLSIPFENNKLILGTWQKIILVELDGPRERRVICNILKE